MTTIDPGHTVRKDPDASVVYTWDWTDWLEDAATIDSFAIAVEGPDALLTVDNDAISGASKMVTMRLVAGTVGKRYRVRCRITTDETPAQIDDRSIWVQVAQR